MNTTKDKSAGARTQKEKRNQRGERLSGTTTKGNDTKMHVQSWLQEMADIAQDQGMHPDNINAVCDCFSELLGACKEARSQINWHLCSGSRVPVNDRDIISRLSAAISKAEGKAS